MKINGGVHLSRVLQDDTTWANPALLFDIVTVVVVSKLQDPLHGGAASARGAAMRDQEAEEQQEEEASSGEQPAAASGGDAEAQAYIPLETREPCSVCGRSGS
jgi:hypothetical protein